MNDAGGTYPLIYVGRWMPEDEVLRVVSAALGVPSDAIYVWGYNDRVMRRPASSQYMILLVATDDPAYPTRFEVDANGRWTPEQSRVVADAFGAEIVVEYGDPERYHVALPGIEPMAVTIDIDEWQLHSRIRLTPESRERVDARMETAA